MGKTLNTFLFIILAYLLPLAGRPALILHYKIAVLTGAAIIIFLTQPGLKWKEARREHKKDRHSVLIILLCSLFAAAIPVIEWAYWPPEQQKAEAFLAGLALIFGGVALRLWAIRTLGLFFTATVQVKEGHRLVRKGPYRLVRHPSYLGAFLAMLGCAVFLQSWVGLLLGAILMLRAYHIRIQAEEQALIAVFGEEYQAFRREAKRMIPFLW